MWHNTSLNAFSFDIIRSICFHEWKGTVRHPLKYGEGHVPNIYTFKWNLMTSSLSENRGQSLIYMYFVNSLS